MQKVRGESKPAASRQLQAGATEAYAADDLGLSFYDRPPNWEVSVREFEEYTRDRLKVLHTFDRVCGFDTPLNQVTDLRTKVAKELADARLVLGYPMMSNVQVFADQKAEFVRRDVVSHFALRLAFCKTRDAREWFLRQEQRLFVLRFESLNPEAREGFLAASGVRCRKFTAASGSHFSLRDLQSASPAAKIWNNGKLDTDTVFYEMPFFEVPPNLISARKVIVHGGSAYVPSVSLKLILAKKFKDKLTALLDVAFQGLPMALSEPRIGGFLRDIQDYGLQLLVAPKSMVDDTGDKLTLENFEDYLVRSFPPCMRRLIEKQRENKKHLKHLGRLQLRPFLKECGFAIEDSYRWWREELCKDPEIDATSFEKNYSYDLEHAYGKKGHLQGQNSFGCPKIIGFAGESAGQVHGCPFRQLEMPLLKQQLHRWRIPESTMNEVDKLITNGKHFQLACIEYFKAVHPGNEGDGVGNTPGDFFRESCRHHMKKKEKEGGGSPEKAKAASPDKAKDGLALKDSP